MFRLVIPPVVPAVPLIRPLVTPLRRPTVSGATPTAIDINIMKKRIGSEILDADLPYFRTKLAMINEIYNIILKHLCLKRSDPNPAAYPLIANITAEINASAVTNRHLRELCLSDSAAVAAARAAAPVAPPGGAPVAPPVPPNPRIDPVTGNCRTAMFEPAKLANLVNSMDTDHFLSKACLVTFRGAHLPANVNIYGGHMTESDLDTDSDSETEYNLSAPNLINVKNIMQDNVESPDKSAILCVHSNGQLKCSVLNGKKSKSGDSNSTNKSCEFCERWARERAMFKSVVQDFLHTPNVGQTLELMAESTHLLPSAIMNKSQYHNFFTAIEEYKKAKKNGAI
jgi:hypothetical protein